MTKRGSRPLPARSTRSFAGAGILVDGDDVTPRLRDEEVGAAASRVAVLPGVRSALLERQRAFRRPPGLVAEGRDMGTVIFPDARLKVFLTASAEERARRRYKQLIEKGNSVTIESLLRDIRERDARDSSRSAAPLRPADGALLLDTTAMTIDEAIALRARNLRGARFGGNVSNGKQGRGTGRMRQGRGLQGSPAGQPVLSGFINEPAVAPAIAVELQET